MKNETKNKILKINLHILNWCLIGGLAAGIVKLNIDKGYTPPKNNLTVRKPYSQKIKEIDDEHLVNIFCTAPTLTCIGLLNTDSITEIKVKSKAKDKTK